MGLRCNFFVPFLICQKRTKLNPVKLFCYNDDYGYTEPSSEVQCLPPGGERQLKKSKKIYPFYFWLICTFLLAFSGCDAPPPNALTPMAGSTPSGTDLGDGVKIFFTDPKTPTAESYRGGPDAELAAAIEEARVSVDTAIYDLNLWSIRDALLNAYRRGVAVRLVIESDNLDEPEIQDLKAVGIPILGDRREGLMHNKFVVIDRSQVWTGSMNFTTTDGYLNNNNLVQVRSTRLAEDYTTEFNEMFQDDLFGPDLRVETPYPALNVNGVPIEVYFSPDDGVEAQLIDLIQAAEQSIYFMAFSFTSDPLAEAILERAQKGVIVAGVMEESQVESNTGSEYDRFRQAGLDIRLDGNPRNMHHKVIVIDEKTVVTGSYNFSFSAENVNDENVLVFHDLRIANQFMTEFERVFAGGHR
jgi:phosphatidylserine/phosphatidylglycerophosphate/cardiolipin synthase-like enzyme